MYVHRETLKEKNKAKKQPRNMRNLLALVLGAAAGLAAVEDPWCCSAGVAPESDCKGLDQHDCEFHVRTFSPRSARATGERLGAEKGSSLARMTPIAPLQESKRRACRDQMQWRCRGRCRGGQVHGS